MRHWSPRGSPLSLCRTSQTCVLIVADFAKYWLLAKLALRRLCAGCLETFSHFPLMSPIAFVKTCPEFVVSQAPSVCHSCVLKLCYMANHVMRTCKFSKGFEHNINDKQFVCALQFTFCSITPEHRVSLSI